jgi:sialidase-1
MRRYQLFYFPALLIVLMFSCKEAGKNPFLADKKEFFDVQQIFDDERFPNVVVATDGSIVATWGSKNVRSRRSEDGGKTWEPEITVANPGFQGGGTTVDEKTGDILFFIEESHPISPLTVYRSRDHGKTWQRDEVVIHPDSKGNVPSMHMNERGITLKHGKYKGRLIRPTRVYGGGNEKEFWDLHYTNAIYSDDGGKNWYCSEPFPVYGTGEAAIEELSDGTIYYNSRRHKSTDGLSPRWRYTALSHDGGRTWENVSVSDVLPDGNQHSDYGLMAGLVRLPVDGHDILLFSNIDVPKRENEEDYDFDVRWTERIRGTVWASFDGGKTWPVKRLVDDGRFAYSSLTAGRTGTPSEGLIFLLYESDGGAKMARFNLAWLTGGRDWKEFINE